MLMGWSGCHKPGNYLLSKKILPMAVEYLEQGLK